MADNKLLYKQLCETENSIPLFMQYWWMEGVCAGKHWDVILSFDHENNIRAAMPFLYNQKCKLKYVLMPQQTQIGGVWVKPEYNNSQSILQDIAQEFNQKIEELGLAYYYQHYPLNSKIAPLMQQFDFKVSDRVTYRINDLSNLDEIIEKFSKNKKRQLQKALSSTVDMDLLPDQFYAFHQQCLAQKHKEISYSREFFLVIYEKAINRHQGQIIAIRGPENQLQAAAFLVWDNQTLYYLIPTYSEAEKASGASARLVLESIRLAKEKTQSFDFEGSIDRGIANHYKQFGSEPTPYCSVEKYYKQIFRLANAYNWLRNFRKR